MYCFSVHFGSYYINKIYTFYSDDWDTAIIDGVYDQSKLSVPHMMWVGIAAAVFRHSLCGHARRVLPLFVGMLIAMDGAVVSSASLTVNDSMNQTTGLFD